MEQTCWDLQIGDLRGRNIFELSGGEKQKIAFASVYAMNPDIYLLDEPSSNLDMAAIRELKEHLSLLKKQGKTILIAEHRLYYLMDVADRIVYLEQGTIAGVYTPAQLRRLSRMNAARWGCGPLICGRNSLKEYLPDPPPRFWKFGISRFVIKNERFWSISGCLHRRGR